jgi:hypothetical protein
MAERQRFRGERTHVHDPDRVHSHAAERVVAAGRCFFGGAAHRDRVPGAARELWKGLWAPAGRTEGPGYGGRMPLPGAAARPRCCGRGVTGDGCQLLRRAVAGP